jgi:hypothetical protein
MPGQEDSLGSQSSIVTVSGTSSEAASSVPASKTSPDEVANALPPSYSKTPNVMSNASSLGNDTSTSVRPSQHSTTNVGPIAGAAVGAAVAAAILAAILTYLLMRSRLSDKKRTNDIDVSTPDDSTYEMNKGYFSESVVEAKDGSGDWMRHLPQPADDVSIVTTIETLCQQIELHVDNFYSNVEPPLDSVSEMTHALLLEIDTGLIQPTFPDAIMNSRSKRTLVKQALAYLILSNITIEEGSPGSLLPQDVAELQRSLESAARYQNKPGKCCPHPIARITLITVSATSQALAYTRLLASYLRPAPYEDHALLAQRERTIKTMATNFCVALEPWSSPGTSSDARYSNLCEIMRGAATCGLLLFSQRATFKFDWNSKDKRPGNNIVVVPGFVKVTDDKARPLDRVFVCKPQVVTELR